MAHLSHVVPRNHLGRGLALAYLVVVVLALGFVHWAFAVDDGGGGANLSGVLPMILTMPTSLALVGAEIGLSDALLEHTGFSLLDQPIVPDLLFDAEILLAATTDIALVTLAARGVRWLLRH